MSVISMTILLILCRQHPATNRW